MLKAITLENFRSFGRRQRIELDTLTALVGPNNSGKSAFMSVGRLVHRLGTDRRDRTTVIASEGGVDGLVHRPAHDDGELYLAWETSDGRYETKMGVADGQLKGRHERLELGNQEAWE